MYARLLLVSSLVVTIGMLAMPDRSLAAAQDSGGGRPGQVISVNQEQIDFGALPSGLVAVRTVTVTNLTAADRPFGGLVLRGPEAFDVVWTTCTLANGRRGVLAGSSCEVSIGFSSAGVELNEGAVSTLLITSSTNPGTSCEGAADCLAKIRLVGGRAP